jgi:hypothetical protein
MELELDKFPEMANKKRRGKKEDHTMAELATVRKKRG